MANEYYDIIRKFQSKIIEYINCILKCYNSELKLLLTDYNLLTRKYNTIESSTTVGYVLEEFMVSKLGLFTKKHTNLSGEFQIFSNEISTAKVSYDCYTTIKTNKKDILAMINIKAEKTGVHNDAVAAINQLRIDYCLKNPKQEKCFMVLKFKYSFAKNDDNRVIKIDDIESYFLEEFDFSKEHRQDNRNWSQNSNRNSGRLKLPKEFKDEHRVPNNKISYQNLVSGLNAVFNRNLKR